MTLLCLNNNYPISHFIIVIFTIEGRLNFSGSFKFGIELEVHMLHFWACGF